MKAEPQRDSNGITTCVQGLIVALNMLILIAGSLLGWFFWALLLYFATSLRVPLLLYAVWIYFDRHSPELGVKRYEFVRRWPIWRLHRDYFPAKLIKTTELPSDQNYIFCCFPHGVLSTGSFCAFANEYSNFRKIFPGLTPRVLTLAQHFKVPFIREYIMGLGAIPASATCMSRMLQSKTPGKVLILMVGGAQESFHTSPGNYTVILKNRKGFVRIALKNGAPLVPVISFGEPDIYRLHKFKEDSFGFKCQMLFKKLTGIAPLIFYGSFSLIPFRKPITTVVGAPIKVDKVAEPTKEEVDNLHARFTEELINLFEKEKSKYLENADDTHLNIL